MPEGRLTARRVASLEWVESGLVARASSKEVKMDLDHDLDIQKQQRCILLIESDPEQAASMQAELVRDGHVVLVARSHLRALSIMEDSKDIDLILVQAEPSDIGGFDFVHLLRHRNRFANQCLQIIVIGSGENFLRFPHEDPNIDDYLLRPYFPGELTWRVRKALRLILERKQALLRHEKDTASGIHTPVGLKQTLHEELNQSFRKQAWFSLSLISFQGTEQIQRDYGLMTAEWMERDIAVHFRDSLRSYDRLGRLEWNRYCLLAPNVDAYHLSLLLRRLDVHMREWNNSVHHQSHIRVPLLLTVKPLTLLPDFEPRHLSAAVALVWNWIVHPFVLEDVASAQYPDIILTQQLIDQGDVAALSTSRTNSQQPTSA
jgi:PleD family two-component response regulator